MFIIYEWIKYIKVSNFFFSVQIQRSRGSRNMCQYFGSGRHCGSCEKRIHSSTDAKWWVIVTAKLALLRGKNRIQSKNKHSCELEKNSFSGRQWRRQHAGYRMCPWSMWLHNLLWSTRAKTINRTSRDGLEGITMKWKCQWNWPEAAGGVAEDLGGVEV